mgnify:CR=1 FL=1
MARTATVSIVVVPSDGELTGPEATASTVVENGIPSATGATISPAVPREADEVVCFGQGWSDPDGDPEGYRTAWTVNGVEVSTAEVLTGADFAKGDAIGCQLTPWDGSIAGEPVSSDPVVVGNTAPSLDGISISPGKPTILANTQNKAVWGLPGHVVSAMVVFKVVVQPFIAHVAGLIPSQRQAFRIPARLSRNIGSAQGRTDFIRVRLTRDNDAYRA